MPDVFFDFLGCGSLCTILIRERVVGLSHKRMGVPGLSHKRMGEAVPVTKLNMFEVPRKTLKFHILLESVLSVAKINEKPRNKFIILTVATIPLLLSQFWRNILGIRF